MTAAPSCLAAHCGDPWGRPSFRDGPWGPDHPFLLANPLHPWTQDCRRGRACRQRPAVNSSCPAPGSHPENRGRSLDRVLSSSAWSREWTAAAAGSAAATSGPSRRSGQSRPCCRQHRPWLMTEGRRVCLGSAACCCCPRAASPGYDPATCRPEIRRVYRPGWVEWESGRHPVPATEPESFGPAGRLCCLRRGGVRLACAGCRAWLARCPDSRRDRMKDRCQARRPGWVCGASWGRRDTWAAAAARRDCCRRLPGRGRGCAGHRPACQGSCCPAAVPGCPADPDPSWNSENI